MRTTQPHGPELSAEAYALRERIIELALEYGHYGYRRGVGLRR